MYSDIVPPFWVRQVRPLVGESPRILDFGCANDSARITKRWFKDCNYHGADVDAASNTASVDVFYLLSLEDDLSRIPDSEFDLVLMKHVIEHLVTPLDTLQTLLRKLKPSGVIYLSFPHPQSVGLPSAEGTLNFYDDPTHLWLPSIQEISGILSENTIDVLRQGTTRSFDKIILGLPLLMLNLARKALGLKLQARGLWDIYGFEYHMIGRSGAEQGD